VRLNVLVFDIETVPDVSAGRRLYRLEGLSDGDVASVMFHKRREETGEGDFLRLHLHRVVTISAVLRSGDGLKVWSLGDLDAPEEELIKRFFDGLDRYAPTLVTWNGSSFDLPVLHYRALLHGVPAPRYWDTGDDDPTFRFNNYLNRFHWRHIDLMDVLAGYQARAAASLDEVAIILGLPGKLGMSGGEVWERYLAGDLAGIRRYCETDVLNTYLIFLRFELMRGRLTRERYDEERGLLREHLERAAQPHFLEFLQAWDGIGGR
jgi:predicted PolB exonuclease-like 3'-5' exonuclease